MGTLVTIKVNKSYILHRVESLFYNLAYQQRTCFTRSIYGLKSHQSNNRYKKNNKLDLNLN